MSTLRQYALALSCRNSPKGVLWDKKVGSKGQNKPLEKERVGGTSPFSARADSSGNPRLVGERGGWDGIGWGGDDL